MDEHLLFLCNGGRVEHCWPAYRRSQETETMWHIRNELCSIYTLGQSCLLHFFFYQKLVSLPTEIVLSYHLAQLCLPQECLFLTDGWSFFTLESVILKLCGFKCRFWADHEINTYRSRPVPSPVVMSKQLSLEEDLVSERARGPASTLTAPLCLFKECWVPTFSRSRDAARDDHNY